MEGDLVPEVNSSAEDLHPYRSQVGAYDDTSEEAHCQSVAYDSGICLSNYRSLNFDRIHPSIGADGLEENLRLLDIGDENLERTTMVFQHINSSTDILCDESTDPRGSASSSSSSALTAVTIGQGTFRLEDQLYEQDEEGDARLHLLIIMPDRSAALNLIEATQIVDYLNIQNNYMHTPLHLAVLTDQPQVVRALVISGASLIVRDRQGNTPLHLACRHGFLECVKQLTAPPGEKEEQYVRNYCEMNGLRQRTIKPMLSGDISLMNYDGETSFHLVLLSNSEAKAEIIHYLVTYCGADINVADGKCGYTILHQAVKAKNFTMVQFLLQYRTLLINEMCYNGCTALDIAVSLHLPDFVQMLTSAGAVSAITESATIDNLNDLNGDSQMDEFDDLMIGGLRLNM